MFCFSRNFLRQTILTTVTALSMTTVVAAQDASPISGLGQSWPNVPDISANPHYHVYRFDRDGVEYIQVNDLQGKVRGAFGVTQGVMFALPMGVDTQNITVIAGESPKDLTQVVYQDDTVTVAAESRADGGANISVLAACPDPEHCSQNAIVVQ